MMRKTVLILAGGTGGHVYPALAVAMELRWRNIDVHWIGTSRGPESQLSRKHEIPFDALSVRPLRGIRFFSWPPAMFFLIWALLKSLYLMWRIRPTCVLGMGGYSSGPSALAALLFRCPLIVHEQNVVSGFTNRFLSGFSAKLLDAYPKDAKEKRLSDLFTGNPVRTSLLALPSPDQRMAGRQGNLRLLILGGSQGSQAINHVIPEAVQRISSETRPEIWHQCGAAMYTEVCKAWGESPAVRVSAFIEEIDEAYAWADIVLCRAGALTLAELSVVGLGALLVPFPHAADDHQRKNAEYFVRAGAGRILLQEKLNADLLCQILVEMQADRKIVLQMAKAAWWQAEPLATQRVADACEDILEKHHA